MTEQEITTPEIILQNINKSVDDIREQHHKTMIETFKDRHVGYPIEKEKLPTYEESQAIENIISPLKDTGPSPRTEKEYKELAKALRLATIERYKPKVDQPKEYDTSVNLALLDTNDNIIIKYKNKADLERISKIILTALKNME